MSDFTSTIYGYFYYLQDEDGLFKNLDLPEGINPDIVISTIMLECGEMQPLYTNPYFMQEMIGDWSQKWARTFEKWAEVLAEEYDPLHNYDRHEDITDTHYTTITNTGDIQGQRSAFDAATFQPHDKTINNLTNQDNGNVTREAHMYGNIGVTTSQQMVRDQLSVVEWNIYEHIKDIFMQEFCIMIY